MPEKESTLAIVIRTVDRTTAGLRAVNQRIKSISTAAFILTAPLRLVGERLQALGKEAGIPKLAAGFKGLGGAVGTVFGRLKDVGGSVTNLLGGFLGISVGIGATVAGLKSIVDHFDALGDVSESAGVSADFLAQMRFAAEKAGASAEQLDAGIQAFSTSLGKARAGTGRLTAFLKDVSPVLLRQLKAADNNEQAFRLLANAMAKIEDPAKRAALAQAAVGDPKLAPLLARGTVGLLQLQLAYQSLAGSQEGAVSAASEVDDSLITLGAAADGVKAALASGLSPALNLIVQQLTEWLRGHREDIRQWAEDIGKKLPGAVDKIVKSIEDALEFVGDFVDAIGGWRVAAGALAVAIAGPLIASLVSLGVTLAANPFGLIVLGVAAATAGVVSLYSEISRTYDLLDTRNERLLADVVKLSEGSLSRQEFERRYPGYLRREEQRNRDEEALIAGLLEPEQFEARYPGSQPEHILNYAQITGRGRFGTANPVNLAPRNIFSELQQLLAPQQPQEVRVKVDFANAPRGTRVTTESQSPAYVDMDVGYQLGFAP